MTPDTTVLALIPHFRCERWLDHCLSSLVEQTRPPDGIVVIDDASPQPPTAIVRRHRGVTLLRSPVNVGPYRLIQQVIEDTAFDWYLFQDADDWSAGDRLAQLLETADRSGAELVGSDYLMLVTDEGLTIPHAFPTDANAALAAAPTCHALQHPTSLVRRRLVERLGGYSSGMRFSGDDEFLRRAAHAARVVNVPRFLYFRRHRPESLTTSPGTGHGSPARRQVLEELRSRALANVAAAQRGEAPVLEPYATAPSIALEHVCGPALDGAPRRRSRPLAAVRRAHHRLVRSTSRPVAPTLIVGGPASGADTLLWSLAQHPSLAALLDVSWLAPVTDVLAQADAPAVTRHATLSADRRLRPLDGLGATPEDLRRALVPAVTGLVGGAADGRSGWVALVPPVPTLIAGLLRLFPDARVVHVVRDADQTASTLARASKAVTAPVPLADAYESWADAARGGLECERTVGADRLLRVHFDELVVRPRETVTRCLRFVGLPDHAACARLLESLELAPPSPVPDEITVSPKVAAARELSPALCGPPVLWRGSHRGGGPAAKEPATGAHGTDRAPMGTGPGLRVPAAAGTSPARSAPVVRHSPTAPVPSGASAASKRAGATAKPAGGKPPAPSGRSASGERQGRPERRPRPAAATPSPHVQGSAQMLRNSVTPGAVVAAVTKGDDRFRDLDGVEVWHFPQTPDGEWAGYHPADTDDVVRRLEEVRRRGARYFLIPAFASWWLEHYDGLRTFLLATGRLVAQSPEGGVLFELGPDPCRPPAPARAQRRRRRSSVSVISWNTTHNPLGRAHVLADLLSHRYDVELVGGRFGHFGADTWTPLRDMEIPLRSFPGGPLPKLLGHLEEFAQTITSDVVVVSKPRLPSYLLGMMAKALGERALILDVDDRELTFVGASRPRSLDDLRQRGNDDLTNPHGRWWTQLCESLVPSADHVTVSNETLRALFGGTIVPHARDERLFDPSRIERDAARARFGFGPHERVVLFGGTPRRHKGVIELAEAVKEIGDGRVRLCLIGTPELDDLRPDLVPYADAVRVVPSQPFARLPELLAAADVVAVLQDPASDVSLYQMPAKVTDALAMQVPCLVRRVPPLEPLVAAGHLEAVGDHGLAAALAALLDDLPEATERARANREVFLSGYSFAAVRPRFEAVVESLLERPPPGPPEHADVITFVKERFGASTPARVTSPKTHPLPRARRPAGDGFDVVMFWKQHDTGLYGRRHDMLMQHLARSPRVGQVIQFDAPVDIATLNRPAAEVPTHTALLRERALARIRGVEAGPGLHQYSFVYARDRVAAPGFPGRDEYQVHVKEALARHRVGERPVVFWVYPKHLEFPELARAFAPDLVVADVVDDHRTWLHPGDANHEPVLRHYQEIASLSDIVLVNCEPMGEVMAGMVESVHLVPNAAEYPDPLAHGPVEVPSELRGLQGPILGYAGNLSSRIDVDLLNRVATQRPDWNLVLLGSSHAGRSVTPLLRHPNVVLLGPRPYEEAKRFIRAFDVAMIPHLDDAMTRAMNPLKAFVYCALGVPVVSTDIRNLGELRSLIAVATDHDDFIAKTDAAIRRGRRGIDSATDVVLRRNSWESRTETVTALIDAALTRAMAER